MDQLTNKKLILTSKTMLFIFRIIFVLLVLMAVIPWIEPSSDIGKFITTLTGFPNIIEHNYLSQYSGQDKNKLFDDFMLHISPLSRILGFIGMIIALLPLLVGTKIMISLAKNYSNGNVFNLTNAKSYSYLGIIYLLSALLLQPLSQAFFSVSASINNPVGHRVIAFGIDINNLTAIFFAIILIVIGQVMKLGQKIIEEQELTI